MPNCTDALVARFSGMGIVEAAFISWDGDAPTPSTDELNRHLYEPRQAKTYLRTCAKCEDRIIPHMRSLIRASALS